MIAWARRDREDMQEDPAGKTMRALQRAILRGVHARAATVPACEEAEEEDENQLPDSDECFDEDEEEGDSGNLWDNMFQNDSGSEGEGADV
jgi:hypothetical protein